MRKLYLFVIFMVVCLGVFIFYLGSDERTSESEIKDCAKNLYNEARRNGMNFSSQCLGGCDGYAVDVVHVPRNEIDNKLENQCEVYRNGSVSHFIELDRGGNVYRIV